MSNASLSLYNLGNQYQDLLNKLYDHETGEIDQDVENELNQLAPSIEKKCVAVGTWLRKIEADKRELEFVKNEIKNREESLKKEIEKWEKYLKSNMERCKITEVRCPYFTIKLKQNPYSTEIVDEALVPEKYIRKRTIIKTEVKVDKNAIKEEVLKTGVQIEGALVAKKTKLEISI